MTQLESNGRLTCSVGGCGNQAVAEAETPKRGWLPVCQFHQDIAWEGGYGVRTIQGEEQ